MGYTRSVDPFDEGVISLLLVLFPCGQELITCWEQAFYLKKSRTKNSYNKLQPTAEGNDPDGYTLRIDLLIYVLYLLQSYAEREHGKVVVYTTSMGVVRQTYQRCLQVSKHILLFIYAH